MPRFGTLGVGRIQLRIEPLLAKARDELGRFTSAQAEIGEANVQAATRLQEMQVQALQQSIDDTGRVQRQTHHLEDAIMSPENRQVTPEGFVVGIEDAYGASGAGLYWRGVEEGSVAHVGRRMFGLWITSDGFARAVEGGKDALGFIGDGRLSGGEHPSGFTIKKEIPAYQFMERGYEAFVSSGVWRQLLLAALDRSQIRTGGSGGG